MVCTGICAVTHCMFRALLSLHNHFDIFPPMTARRTIYVKYLQTWEEIDFESLRRNFDWILAHPDRILSGLAGRFIIYIPYAKATLEQSIVHSQLKWFAWTNSRAHQLKQHLVRSLLLVPTRWEQHWHEVYFMKVISIFLAFLTGEYTVQSVNDMFA